MRLGIVRQRYTPFGGAERFVERAIDALAERGVRPARLHAALAGVRGGDGDRARHLRPVLHRQPLARRELRPRRAGRARARPPRPRADRTSASTAATSSAPATASTASGSRSGCAPAGAFERLAHRRQPLPPLHPRRRGAGVRRPGAQGGDLHFADGEGRHPRALRDRRAEAARHLQRGRPARVRPAGARRIARRCGAASASPTSTSSSCSSARAMRARACPTAIRALARLPAAARLVVVGRDKRQARYPALAARLGRRAIASSSRDRRRSAPWYGAADAFVLPTLYDPLSNAVLEALACGLPVVTSTPLRRRRAGREFGAGTVCRAADIDAIAAGMRELMDDGDAGRPRAARDGRGRRAHPGGDERAAARALRLAAAGPARRRDYNRDLPCGAARDAAHGARSSPMCGITGFHSHRPDARAAPAGDDRVARASRARRRRLPLRRPGRPRPPPAVGHRPRRQPAAAAERRRQRRASSSTARSTTSARCAHELAAAGHALRTARRQRGDGRRLAGSGARACSTGCRGMFAFALWDRGRQRALPRPRPPRREAALLRVARRRRSCSARS